MDLADPEKAGEMQTTGATMLYSVLDLIMWGLAICAFGMSAFALIHAIRTPARAFAVTGKQTKRLWLIILSLASVFSFMSAVGYFGLGGLSQLNLFVIASVIASGIYMADVRPAVSEVGKNGNSGPYGPW
ncbi:DUF2516 family protein [Sinosporangium siamense]|uniref:DUF2516 family protein n=1 Tax=Sinosporangium siamense TaxID=1367973 RepID=A0A919RJ83_9ACTN|nr:DUF2516 family protein [Sinosporangium siamense]GII93359.1 hypothetical protein Ssi02_35900 [Sinosporangium siamense]